MGKLIIILAMMLVPYAASAQDAIHQQKPRNLRRQHNEISIRKIHPFCAGESVKGLRTACPQSNRKKVEEMFVIHKNKHYICNYNKQTINY